MSSPSDANAGIRYRFGPFVLSPAQRLLLRDGVEVRLIPRYFDLLRLLIERRDEAVHRQEIFDRVWADVIVSDGALSQAIRTLRRALGDDPREPVFIRTVSRHGYQFVLLRPDRRTRQSANCGARRIGRHGAAWKPRRRGDRPARGRTEPTS